MGQPAAPSPFLPGGRTRRAGLEVLCLGDPATLGADIVVTTRRGGVSTGPFASLNLGDHVGDDPLAVEENRRRMAAAMGVDRGCLAVARQVHGADVSTVRKGDDPGDADVLATTDEDVAICVLVADCVPMAILDPIARVVVVAHAGWRGTAAGVAHAAVGAATRLGAAAANCHAFIGPCISAQRYQVGDEVAAAFESAGRADAITPDGSGRFLADLRAANVAQLREAGLHADRITCPVLSTDDGTVFFSDRAQRPCGRFALSARLRTPSS